jgi:hypothetical protein
LEKEARSDIPTPQINLHQPKGERIHKYQFSYEPGTLVRKFKKI